MTKKNLSTKAKTIVSKDSTAKYLTYLAQNPTNSTEIRYQDETIWATQKILSAIYDVEVNTINYHIKKIFQDGELEPAATIRRFRIVQSEGQRKVEREIEHYNIQIIIAVGFKVENERAVAFRRWINQIAKDYIIKGFALDDQRLKEQGGGNYFKELLERIRDIRSSEKALYRQVLDLYATSADYDPKSPETLQFFRTVQNKLHYATNRQTAAEIIYNRADSAKDFMGLTTFAGATPVRSEVVIAKNYLTARELYVLQRLVSAFFDLAEIRAQSETMMYMKDWVRELDNFSVNYGKGALKGGGKISHQQAIKKALDEYLKYQAKTLSPVEVEYLDTMKRIEKSAQKRR